MISRTTAREAPADRTPSVSWAPRCAAARPDSRRRMWTTTSCARGGARSRPGWSTGCAAARPAPAAWYSSTRWAPARPARRTAAGSAADPAGHDRGHPRAAARFRLPVPARLQPGAVPLGTARASPATRRADPADPGIPGRRPALRRRRAPPGIDRRGGTPGDDRRLRHRSAHRPAGTAMRNPRGSARARRPASPPGSGNSSSAPPRSRHRTDLRAVRVKDQRHVLQPRPACLSVCPRVTVAIPGGPDRARGGRGPSPGRTRSALPRCHLPRS